jgi:cellulose synthase (UDP-forming)
MNEKIDEGIIRAKTPLRSELKTIRVLIGCGLISMLIFIYWFFGGDHVGYAPIFWMLTFALIFKLVKMLHEWYHYWSPSVPKMPVSTRQWKVDVLTTACPGEPREMIVRTLRAMKEIRYPHTNYLCDEGNDPVLKELCESLGVIHVTRIEKKDAKAGNINNALKQASGEIAVVLDPDHVPVPEFLDRVLPYFEDETIGYVQCVQGYGNQEESFIARGAAEQTYHFYGPMMMCMNTYGTVQAIGANCAFRRTALDSIGGHAPGLAEDMHTAMQLHAKGWRSIYVPEMLTRGLVPATLSAYYKQQLKWSRGTFDLLFHVFPKLYKNFTWRQKVHYLCIPMYFLFGLVNLIDFLVPVLALGTAEVPWQLDLTHFAAYFVPLCSLSLCIRLYAQRWLLEKHEKGFHFAGGILRTATWWIFLIGFVYTIFNIKVPYIPTPKEDEHENYVRLSIPNILVFLCGGFFVIYGLSIDWTPYSLAMAFYSIITVSMLIFTVTLSQQKFMLQAERWFSAVPGSSFAKRLFNSAFIGTQQFVYTVLRQGVVVPILAFSSVIFGYSDLKPEDGKRDEGRIKDCGGFYLGRNHSEFAEDRDLFNIVAFEQTMNSLDDVKSEMQVIRKGKAIPFFKCNVAADQVEDILNGGESDRLKQYAAILRNYRDPLFFSVFISNGNTSADEYKKVWQYMFHFLNDLGVSNITWVWCPAGNEDERYYPGEKYVDWMGVRCPDSSKTFAKMYEPFRNRFGKFKKQVLIDGITSRLFLGSLKEIREKYKEIHSVILTKNEDGSDDLVVLKTQLQAQTYFSDRSDRSLAYLGTKNESYRSKFVKGEPGKFKLYVNSQPYYIKGVAYNTAHDWRDGNMPLTRRQVVKDLTYIKEMGANTIRRYGSGIYDRNILNIAEEFDLNVLFGFWFDPKVDFFGDSVKVKKYMADVEEKVKAYKDHSSVIAWSLGNESWGLLKHHFAKPYLTLVRNAYVQMIEHMAQRIHELDPTRPVFSCVEHEEYQLAGELASFHDGAPSIDVMGVNSYYKEQISKLQSLAGKFDSLRPYLVSEFGPNGYWDPKYNRVTQGKLQEQTDEEKAEWYKRQWNDYVENYKGYNIGGFAYCWHDRMEGSYTWFGLTDFKGRPKASYYALKEEWTNSKQEILPEIQISGPLVIVPGKEYEFKALSNNSSGEELNYEWKLLKDEYLEPLNTIEGTEKRSITLKVPKEASNCRLYLFVSDKENKKVSTASIPLKIKGAL